MLKNLRSRNVFGYPRLKPVGEKRTAGFFITSQVSEGVHLNLKVFLPAVILMTILISIFFSSCNQEPARANEYFDDEIANAIYKTENSVKYPYGIKSIPTYGNKDYARKICLNTIRNNRKRFAKQNKYTDFIEFLGSRYCPPSAHKLNKNWVRNVKFYLK